MELTAQCRQQVHARVRLAFQQRLDVVARYLETGALLERDRIGLVRGLFQHGCESEEFTAGGFIDRDLLLVLVNGCDPDLSGKQYVRLTAGVAPFIYPFARGKVLELYLRGKDCGFIRVEQ